MSKFGKIVKAGLMGGLAGAAAKAGGVGINDVARSGGLGLMGLALAKKKKQVAQAPGGPAMGGRTGPTVDRGENTKEYRKGGKVKKMAKGGSASRRADGCATQGKTKGRFV